MPKKLKVEVPVLHKYPNTRTAAICVRWNAAKHEPLMRETCAAIREQISTAIANNEVDKAIIGWKQIFQSMGAKPKYASSVEQLFESHRSGDLPAISTVVDFYNHLSLSSGLPMAAYDRDKIVGDLRLAIPGKGHSFVPMNSRGSPEKTKEHEVAYLDEQKVVCRYWNLRDCDETKVTSAAVNILFVFDCFDWQLDAGRPASFYNIVETFRTIFADDMTFAGVTTPSGTEILLC